MFVVMARVCKADKEGKADSRANDASTAPKHPSSPAEAPATKKKRSRLFCSYCKKVNHTVDTYRSLPGTITILNGGGQMAPNGCTLRIAAGRVEKKKNKKNNMNKKADQKLADKVSESVSAAMQLE
ncbi:hypothetical protein FAGAP_9390 [Fusarium agapanthi]|uniref:Uncharacterized protein n=1 Tax=Fusarium agapanthi TaxID=1803897 RepID=A0A9P5B323_9HYPO|nr:hypothetical protein FAGAP_9390 [Fusarium agapanthi]